MKAHLPIRNIIFDFGGVILDIDPLLTLNELKNLGVDDLDIFQSPIFQQDVMQKFERGILTPEVFRDKVRDFIGIPLCDQDIDDAWNALLLDIPKERIKVLEDVKKNYPILLLCNSNEIHYVVSLRDLQLRFGYREFDQLFTKAYFSFDLHLSKPNPEIFEFVMHQHKLIPEETLFIDDTAEHIEVASNLGFRVYQLQKPERVRDLFINGILREDLSIR